MRKQIGGQTAEKIIRDRSRSTKLRRGIALMSAFVMLFTMNSLKMDADTLERTPMCGIEEHVHTRECFDPVLICTQEERGPVVEEHRVFTANFKPHAHTADCYDDSGRLACGYVANEYIHVHSGACYDENHRRVCGLEERRPHVHTDACYAETVTLICGLEEAAAHTHTDECWAETVERTCGLEESDGHAHTDACYRETTRLACGLEESEGHVHTDACYSERRELSCAQAESDGHRHGSGCYSRQLVCGLAEGEEHTHSDGCYQDVLTCGRAEGEGAHHHTDACYTTVRELTCGRAEGEGAHHHTDACYVTDRELICGHAEGEGAHHHTGACDTVTRELVCGLEETEGHTHTEACYHRDRALVCGQDMAEKAAAQLGLEHVQLHAHNRNCFYTITRRVNGEDRAITLCGCGYWEVPEFKATASDWTTVATVVDPGHAHTDACWQLADEPVCGLEEHVHTDACYQQRPEKDESEAETPADEIEQTPAEAAEPVATEAPGAATDGALTDLSDDRVTIVSLSGGLPADSAISFTADDGAALEDVMAYLAAQAAPQKKAKAKAAPAAATRARSGSYTDYASFDISLLSGGEPLSEPGAVRVTVRPEDLNVLANLPEGTVAGDIGYVLYHVHDGAVEELDVTVDERDGVVGSFTFETSAFSGFVLGYTVSWQVEAQQIAIGLDFGEFDRDGLPEDVSDVVAALESGVAIDLSRLFEAAEAPEEGVRAGFLGLSFDRPAEYDQIDFASLEPVSAEGGLSYADGRLLVSGNGTIELTDGWYTLKLTVTGYAEAVAVLRELVGDGVKIEVLQGEVPEAAEAACAALDEAAAQALADEYLPEAEAAGQAAFDVKILSDGAEFTGAGEYRVTLEPDLDVSALVPAGAKVRSMDCRVYHIHEGVAEELPAEYADGRLVFTTDGFSDFLVRYTVDFHYEVDGRTFEWSLPGGGAASVRDLAAALGIVDGSDPEALRAFAEQVTDVAFSDESLVRPVPVTEGITYGALKQKWLLAPEYSVELTEADIEAMDATRFEAPDWALVSLKPFDTEETLTVTLATGETFTVAVTDGQIIRDFITATGETYAITVLYGEDAGIPEGADLEVEEILPDDERYNTYYDRATQAANLADEPPEADGEEASVQRNHYARFFDITIVSGGEAVQPAAPVTVVMALKDVPEGGNAAATVVHFEDEGPSVVPTTSADESDLRFDADSFSVYGMIVGAGGSSSGGSLDGMTAKISCNGQYLTNNNNYNNNPWVIPKTGDVNQAAEYTFTATGNPGEYTISTTDANGATVYININGTASGNNPANRVNLAGYAMPLHVVENADGTYGIYRSENGRDYYLNQWSGAGGPGFACWPDRDGGGNSKLTFTTAGTQNPFVSGREYMTLVKYNDKYYIVNNDASLTETLAYHPDTNSVEVEEPMLWMVNKNDPNGHIYMNSRETGFDDRYIASDSYRRYLDPASAQGWTEENASNVTVQDHNTWTNPDTGELVHNNYVADRSAIEAQTAVSITGGEDGTYAVHHGDAYLGIVFDEDGNPVRLVGQKDSGEAAEILFATPSNVKTVNVLNNTVNHIDISIEGTANVDVPLAYGSYYGPSGDAADPILVVNTNTKVELNRDHMVDPTQLKITADDIKRATITATCNGKEIDDAFYITGYTGNVQTSLSADQVRIEGSFLVADLRGTQYERLSSNYTAKNWGTWADPEYRNAVNAEHLANRVEYTVTVIKPLQYYLTGPDGNQLYDEDGEPIVVTVDVAFSASFNYWDEGNECPAVRYAAADGTDSWRAGGIDSSGLSGMDFVLGGDADNPNSPLVALEITKIIVDEAGRTIHLKVPVTTYFDIYENKNASNYEKNHSVNELHVNEYGEPDPRDANVHDGYQYWATKRIKVGETGSAIVFDFNATDAMYYIREHHGVGEDEDLPLTVTDQDGNEWSYVRTFFETEYIRRGDKYDDKALYPSPMHVTQNFTDVSDADPYAYASIPEVAGHFTRLDGEAKKEGFLEFFVYNVYTNGTKLEVEKNWQPENAAPMDGTEITVELQYRTRKVGETVDGEVVDVTPGEWSEFAPVADQKGEGGLFGDKVNTTLILTANETAENNWKGVFAGLPKTVTDAGGDVYEVDYSAVETRVRIPAGEDGAMIDVTDQYTATCEKQEPAASEAEFSDGKVTITNLKGGIGIKKVFRHQNGEAFTPANSSAVITADLVRVRTQTSEPVVETVTVRIVGQANDYNNGNPVVLLDNYEVQKGSTLWFSTAANGTSMPAYAPQSVEQDASRNMDITYSNGITKSGANVYKLSDIQENTTITATFPDGKVMNDGMGYYIVEVQAPAIDPTVDEEVVRETITLSQLNGWNYVLAAEEMESGWYYYIDPESVQETGINENQFLFSDPVLETDEDGNQVYVCTNTERENVNVTVRKQWDPLPTGGASATVELHRYAKKTLGTLSVALTDQNGSPVPGATFELYENGAPTGRQILTGADGVASVSGLTAGTYKLVEVSAPDGYSMEGHVTQTPEWTVEDVTTPQSHSDSLQNTRLEAVGSATLTVTDDAGAPIEGAVFALKRFSETVGTYTTGADGTIQVSGLPTGTYTFVQTGTPEAYHAPANAVVESFTIVDDLSLTQAFEREMVNTRVGRGSATVTLTKAEDSSALPGVEFQLLRDGAVVRTGTTDATGALTFNDLGEGSYTLHQSSGELQHAADQTFGIVPGSQEQHHAFALTNEETVGNVTVQVWHARPRDQYNQGIIENKTFDHLKPGVRYVFHLGVPENNVVNGDYLGYMTEFVPGTAPADDDVTDIDKSLWTPSGSTRYFDLEFTPTQNDTTYNLALVSGWGIDNATVTMQTAPAAGTSSAAPLRAAPRAKAASVLRSGVNDAAVTLTDAAPHRPSDPDYVDDASFTDDEYTVTLDGTEATPWQHVWEGLPKYDANGDLYYYYIVETSRTPTKYHVASYEGDPLSSSGTITVTNEYDAVGSTTFEGTKTIENRAFREGDALSVSISSTDGGRLPDPATVTVPLTAGQTAAAFAFNEVAYALSDLGGATSKTFHYTVTETAVMAGTAADTRAHTIEVTVTDDGTGTLAIEKVYRADGEAEAATAFVNTYDTSVDLTVSGTKELLGEAPADGQFRFRIEAVTDGAPMPQTAEVPNDAAGGFAFGPITYALSHYRAATEYRYKITEVVPGDSAVSGGILYDEREIAVTVTLRYDEASGVLTATPDVTAEQLKFTNTPLTSVNADKRWLDVNGDAFEDLPEGATVTFALYRDGGTEPVLEVVMDGTADAEPEGTAPKAWESAAWTVTFGNLPKYREDGSAESNYVVRETEVTGVYGFRNQSESGVAPGGTIENRQESTEVHVDKQWLKNDGTVAAWPTGIQSVTVELLADGEAVDSAELTAQKQEHTFDSLPRVHPETGEVIAYTVREIAVDGYESTVTGSAEEGWTITNTPKKTRVTVTKAWSDEASEDHEGDWVKVALQPTGDEQRLDSGNDWTYTWSSLPVVDDATGNEIAYAVVETEYHVENDLTYASDSPEESPKALTKNGDGSYAVTITNTPGDTVDHEAVKTWAGGKWPTNVTVTFQLKRNGTPYRDPVTVTSQTEGHKAVWTALPKTDDTGAEYTYTVEETVQVGERRLIPGADYTAGEWTAETSGSTTTWTIENALTPVDIPVEKAWARGVPYATAVRFELRASGEKVTTDAWGEGIVNPLELSEETEWKNAFTGLAKYGADGQPIAYEVVETGVQFAPDGEWQPAEERFAVTTSGSQAEGFTITNTPIVTNVSVDKHWFNGAADVTQSIQNAYATVRLTDGADPVTKDADGNAIADVELSTENGWTHIWQNLYKYDAEGREIAYQVVEVDASHEAQASEPRLVDGAWRIDNTLPTIDIPVKKVWDGAELGEGDFVEFTLYRGGETEAYAQTGLTNPVALNADSQWEGAFNGLPKYADNGTLNDWTVEETKVKLGAVECTGADAVRAYFGAEASDDQGTRTITNAVTSHSVRKTWGDGQLPPEGAQVTIELSGGEGVDLSALGVTDTTVTLSGEPWTHTWQNLPVKDANGAAIAYTATETAYTIGETTVDPATLPAGAVVEGVQVFTNDIPTTSVSAKKNWADGQPPAGTVVELTLTGTVGDGANAANLDAAVATQTATLNGTEDPAWQHTWEDLPMYDRDGREIAWTVAETAYRIGEATQETAPADETPAEGFDFSFTNTVPTIDIPVEKIWNDYVPQEGDWVKLTLYRNEETGAYAQDGLTNPVILNADSQWKGAFSDLPKYGDNGAAITYTVVETEVCRKGAVLSDPAVIKTVYGSADGTVTSTDAAIAPVQITNTVEKVTVSGAKKWIDGGTRPDGLTIALYRVGADPETGNEVLTEVATQSTDAAQPNYLSWQNTTTDAWGYTIANLEKYDEAGNEIVWRVVETVPEGYLAANEGVADQTGAGDGIVAMEDLVNTEKTKVTAAKEWANLSGELPEGSAASFKLVRSTNDVPDADFEQFGTVDGTVETGSATGELAAWVYTWDDLPKYDADGAAYAYVVSEVQIRSGEDQWTLTNGADPTGTWLVETTVDPDAENAWIITNTRNETTLTVTKLWEENEQAIAWPDGASIALRLTRRTEEAPEEDDAAFGAFELTVTKGEAGFTVAGLPEGATANVETSTGEDGRTRYAIRIEGLKLGYSDESGAKRVYTYYLKETGTSIVGFNPSYTSDRGEHAEIAKDGYTITNRRFTAELPHTGGAGTGAFYALGGALMALAAAWYAWTARRRAQRD